MSTRFFRLLAIAAITLAFGLTACGADGGSDAEESTTTVAGVEAPEAPDPGDDEGGSSGSSLELDLPRSITYGVLGLEVTGARQSDEHPVDAAQTVEDTSYIGLELTVTNPTEDLSFQLPPAGMTLEAGDEESEPGFNDEGTVAVDADDSSEVEVWFPMASDVDLSDLDLVIALRNTEPARLPLVGEEPATESVEVDVEAASFQDGGASVELAGGGELTLNALVFDGEPGAGFSYGTFADGVGRGFEDQALLHIPATASESLSGLNTFYGLGTASFGYRIRATADGEPIQTINNFPGQLNDQSFEGEFVAAVPRGSKSVTYEIGEFTGQEQNSKTWLTVTVDVSEMEELFTR